MHGHLHRNPPPATLSRARAIAIGNGLHHVYTGNVHDIEGGTTFCPTCREALVQRDWYVVLSCRIETRGEASGTCPHCGTPIAGRFGAFTGGFGRRRIPVRMGCIEPFDQTARGSGQGDESWT